MVSIRSFLVLFQLWGLARALPMGTESHALEAESVPNFSRIVLWGDSLSDNGNGTFLYTNRTWPDDPGYFNGRFSDGPTWIEHVAHHIAGNQLDDLAYGGSTVNNTRVQGYTGALMTLPVPSVLEVVQRYLAHHTVDPEALYVVTGGSNDVFYGALRPEEDPVDLAKSVARDIAHVISLLRERGGRNFLVPSVPALGYSPWYRKNRPTAPDSPSENFFRIFVATFREYFAQLLSPDWDSAQTAAEDQLVLTPRTSGSHRVVFWQQEQLYRDLARGKVGNFTNVEDACLVVKRDTLTGAPLQRSVCAKPDTYLFWDDYHPSAMTHEYIAAHAQYTLAHAYALH